MSTAIAGRQVATGLPELVAGLREVVARGDTPERTVRDVTAVLRRRLPTPDVLTAEQRFGSPEGYRSHLLHVEPDGSFSIVALVWRPGQATAIHDHVAWCSFGVIQGIEYEELYD